MYKGKSIIAVIPARDEESKIGRVVERIDFDLVDTVLVVDDGSTDATAEVALRRGAKVISLDRICGVGAAIRAGLQFGRHTGHDLAVILAGNNKDHPSEIPRLLDPICNDDADFVMGSRYLPGGSAAGDMPLYRRLATRLHPWLMSRFAGKQLTESTNGFRAFKLSLLDDSRINLEQRWLDSYGLEVYLLWKVLTLGHETPLPPRERGRGEGLSRRPDGMFYRHSEVPCTKVYPPRSLGFTKMKPIIDWWTILRPILLLGLGMKS